MTDDDELKKQLLEMKVKSDAVVRFLGKEGEEIAYPLWVALTKMLTQQGWSPDDLGRDAARHATDEILSAKKSIQ